jgi:hypothetical protein
MFYLRHSFTIHLNYTFINLGVHWRWSVGVSPRNMLEMDRRVCHCSEKHVGDGPSGNCSEKDVGDGVPSVYTISQRKMLAALVGVDNGHSRARARARAKARVAGKRI